LEIRVTRCSRVFVQRVFQYYTDVPPWGDANNVNTNKNGLTRIGVANPLSLRLPDFIPDCFVSRIGLNDDVKHFELPFFWILFHFKVFMASIVWKSLTILGKWLCWLHVVEQSFYLWTFEQMLQETHTRVDLVRHFAALMQRVGWRGHLILVFDCLIRFLCFFSPLFPHKHSSPPRN